MSGTRTGKNDLGSLNPVLQEGHNPQTGGIQRMVTVPMGPPLVVDGATYKGVVFVAPCNGCQIKELWCSSAVAAAGGTNTLAFDNYDASANAARNALSTANIDPTTIPAKEGLQLTLTATETDLYMDVGDVLNFTYVTGTQTTNAEGNAVTAVIWVPDLL